MSNIITDMETWLLDEGDRIYRYLVYKKLFTPYEEKHAFMDESVFEDTHYELCQIEEAIDLGNGEWMLGLRSIGEDGKIYGRVEYYKLSEIRLARFDNDKTLELYYDKEDEEEDDEL